MYKPPHSIAWPGWLCGALLTEKRPWPALRWQAALRTLAGRPTAGPAVNPCFILSLRKILHTDAGRASVLVALLHEFSPASQTHHWKHTQKNIPIFSVTLPIAWSYPSSSWPHKDLFGSRNEGSCHVLSKAWINPPPIAPLIYWLNTVPVISFCPPRHHKQYGRIYPVTITTLLNTIYHPKKKHTKIIKSISSSQCTTALHVACFMCSFSVSLE